MKAEAFQDPSAQMKRAMFGSLVIGAIAVVIAKVSDPSMQAGWPSLMATMLICSGVILLFLGIIGEYIGRLFITANKSPQYVVHGACPVYLHVSL